MSKPKEFFQEVCRTKEIVFDSLKINNDFDNEVASLFLLLS
jgi:hypothetical protein